MNDLTTLLGDIECHLSLERCAQWERYVESYHIDDSVRVDMLTDLIDRVRKALVELDKQRIEA